AHLYVVVDYSFYSDQNLHLSPFYFLQTLSIRVAISCPTPCAQGMTSAAALQLVSGSHQQAGSLHA
ncbi:hypothetical protein, partial [Alcanivorax profundi]|uniref:hypothetical protein n=1 Tax=Alcanivorax profundi TaxID=2338368 RepID=UPI0032B1CB54